MLPPPQAHNEAIAITATIRTTNRQTLGRPTTACSRKLTDSRRRPAARSAAEIGNCFEIELFILPLHRNGQDRAISMVPYATAVLRHLRASKDRDATLEKALDQWLRLAKGRSRYPVVRSCPTSTVASHRSCTHRTEPANPAGLRLRLKPTDKPT